MRINSATLNASATPLPSAQAASSGGSFQAVLAHATPDRNVDVGPTRESASDARSGKPESHAANGTVAATAEGTATDDQSTAPVKETSMQDTQSTSVAAEVEASTVLAAPSNISTVATTTLSQVASGTRHAYFQEAGAVGAIVLSGLEDVGSAAAGVVATGGGTAHTPVKQDRSKAQPDGKCLLTLRTADIAAVDPRTMPAVSVSFGQGSPRCQQSHDAAELASRDLSPATASRATGKPAATAEGGVGDSSAAPAVTTTAIAAETGTGIQNSGDSLGGFETLVLAGVAGTAPLGKADGAQETGKPLERGIAAASGSGGSKANASTNSSDGASTGFEANSSHAGVTGGQQPPVASQDATKGSVTAVRPTDNASLQGTVQTTVHDGGISQREAGGASDTPRAAKAEVSPAAAQPTAGETVTSAGINSSKIIQTMGQTEMHVGMHSEEFGDISIRTALSQQQMVTQISVAHTDLSQAISTHLWAAQAKLGEEYGLHASIEVNNQGSPLSGGQGDSRQSDQQSFARSPAVNPVALEEVKESSAGVVAVSSVGSGSGLDIRV